MKNCLKILAAGMVAAAAAMPQIVVAQSIDFGDDNGMWAKDGECDDPRFEGPGMTETTLLDEDILHDATDCRTAFRRGQLSLKKSGDFAAGTPRSARVHGIDVPIGTIDFGIDAQDWANDGECDDVRFTGSGMAVSLVVDAIGRDASDCRSAFTKNTVQLSALYATPTDDASIQFGDNSGDYADDGECDDIRFTGDYASGMIYLAEDIGHDANDCRAAMGSGAATWQGMTATPNYGMITGDADLSVEDSEETV